MYTTIEIFPEELRNYEKKLSEKPTIHPTAYVKECILGSWTEIGARSRYNETTFGDYSYDDGDVIITYTEIGKFCSIASHVRINPVNHPKERVTQHHCTYRRVQYHFGNEDDKGLFDWRRDQKCTIGHDVWVGHGAIIMPGVKIGTGTIIGSGAVVTKDINPYEITVGVPAKVIKKRFDDDTINKLLKIEWWNWDRNIIEERFNDLYDIDIFLEKYY